MGFGMPGKVTQKGFEKIGFGKLDRLEKLENVAGAMQTQRNLQGKGMRRKVGKADAGKPTVYKWKKERKKWWPSKSKSDDQAVLRIPSRNLLIAISIFVTK